MTLSLACMRWSRLIAIAVAVMAAILLTGGRADAEGAAFDLAGPSLQVSVTHGGTTLPLSQVPNLAAGDRLRIAVDLPAEQGARYRLILAFLRGATNPPPKEWLHEARTWKPKEATIDAIVPVGAEQAMVFLVPDTGGAFDAVASAVRNLPGAFVRASQELNQAMLDRTRLETFLDAIRRRTPAEVKRVSPQLAQSLSVKLDPGCLLERADPRAACLTQGSSAAVLADAQTSSIAQTLAGAPATIALQLSATPQAGFGYYSSYIGVVRDLARMLGAFQSAQLRFIPALNVQRAGKTELLLNTVPSFRKPQSVLVVALPTVAPPTLPPLRARGDTALCLAQPGLTLPTEGAPLAFSTAYARDLALRVSTVAGQTLELPVTADAATGGFVLGDTKIDMASLGPAMDGMLHGLWGFAPFDGPRFRLVAATPQGWRVGDAALVTARDAPPLVLRGGTAACVAEVWAARSDTRIEVKWTARADGALSIEVPAAARAPGPVAILVRSHGIAQPQRLDLRAVAPLRPAATLLSRSIAPLGAAPPVALTLDDAALLPHDARLTFSLRAEGETRFKAGDMIEVDAAEADKTVRLPIQLQDDRIALATLDPASALGDSARGPLRFRLVQGALTGDWQPLATLVRLPRLQAIACETAHCTLTGSGLFLVRGAAPGASGQPAMTVPDGFTGPSIAVPRLTVPRAAGGDRITLFLRDAPATATVRLPATIPGASPRR